MGTLSSMGNPQPAIPQIGVMIPRWLFFLCYIYYLKSKETLLWYQRHLSTRSLHIYSDDGICVKLLKGVSENRTDYLPFMEYCWSLRYHWVKALRICKIIDLRLLHLFPTWPPKPLWTNNYRELWVIEHNLWSDIVNNNALTIFLLSFI